MSDLRLKLISPGVEKTCGRNLYLPDCPISRALCMSKIETYRKKPHVLPKEVSAFAQEGFGIEYTGRRNDFLDKLGAEKTDE